MLKGYDTMIKIYHIESNRFGCTAIGKHLQYQLTDKHLFHSPPFNVHYIKNMFFQLLFCLNVT